jgi:hypothetical protein
LKECARVQEKTVATALRIQRLGLNLHVLTDGWPHLHENPRVFSPERSWTLS